MKKMASKTSYRQADDQPSIRQFENRSLHVLGVRNRLVSPGKLLSSALITPVLTELRACEWVILDFAPVIPMADVGEVLPHVDGALMVIRSGKTDISMIAPSLEILGTKIWGVVVNDSTISGSAYYGYYVIAETRTLLGGSVIPAVLVNMYRVIN